MRASFASNRRIASGRPGRAEGESALRRAFVLALAVVLALPTMAQRDKDSFTPVSLDAGFGRIDLSEPPIPIGEIIRRFSARESDFEKALARYTWRRTIRVQSFDDDDKVDGEWYQIDDVLFNSTGRRIEKTSFAPENTLKHFQISPSDLQDLQNGMFLVLTQEEIGLYNLKYAGRQRVDEVDCYVFDVAPKAVEKHKRYFQGRIWVDATDLLIVVTHGRMIPDDTRRGHEDLHPPFMTWRQQVDGQYWFPVYTKGEGTLHFVSGSGDPARDAHIRETIQYSDYKRFGSTTTFTMEGPAEEPKKK